MATGLSTGSAADRTAPAQRSANAIRRLTRTDAARGYGAAATQRRRVVLSNCWGACEHGSAGDKQEHTLPEHSCWRAADRPSNPTINSRKEGRITLLDAACEAFFCASCLCALNCEERCTHPCSCSCFNFHSVVAVSRRAPLVAPSLRCTAGIRRRGHDGRPARSTWHTAVPSHAGAEQTTLTLRDTSRTSDQVAGRQLLPRPYPAAPAHGQCRLRNRQTSTRLCVSCFTRPSWPDG